MFNIKKNAFTLSEVLIALTIIGVVAAITVPRVMTGSKTKADVVKLKRAYIAIQDALRIASAKQNYNMSDITSFKKDNNHPYNAQDLLAGTFDAKLLSSSYTYNGIPGSKNQSGNYTYPCYGTAGNIGACTTGTTVPIAQEGDLVYSGRNGVYYIIKAKAMDDDTLRNCSSLSKPCMLYIDINGKDKGPNEIITCNNNTETRGTFTSSNGDYYYTEPTACEVDDRIVTDIYLFYIFDGEVRPATSATVAVLEK